MGGLSQRRKDRHGSTSVETDTRCPGSVQGVIGGVPAQQPLPDAADARGQARQQRLSDEADVIISLFAPEPVLNMSPLRPAQLEMLCQNMSTKTEESFTNTIAPAATGPGVTLSAHIVAMGRL